MNATVAFAKLAHTAQTLRPEVALVLGSGMGAVARRLQCVESVPFGDVPDLTAPSVIGHGGTLTLGEWAGRRVLVFEGRLHFYEGHSWRSVTAPVQTAAYLGAKVLLLTNAAGGIHDTLAPGCLMAIRDHIEWTRPYCWRHPGRGGMGPARPSPYSPHLLKLLTQSAHELDMELHEGTYAAVTGPCYETPAEIRALRTWGADAVGMSTAREVQAGFDRGMSVAAISCITNRAAGLSASAINHEEVLSSAAGQADRLAELIESVMLKLTEEDATLVSAQRGESEA
ncbi:MAG: purine-nucleoside phosphorylase [Gemmataceae bacterium]|nr:purine-nucleoside phosphorylase [Gemmataceae bacterium]